MSYYLFYRFTESRRLSQPSWQASHRDGLSARRQSLIAVLTGLGVE